MADLAHSSGAAPLTPPRVRWRIGAADIVVGVAIALTVVVFGIFGLLCLQGYSATLAGAKAKALGSAEIVAGQGGWIIGSSLGTLNQTAYVAMDDPAIINADMKAGLDKMFVDLPYSGNLGIFDASGQSTANGRSASLPANIADQGFFQKLASGTDWIVSPQLADMSTGKPIFVVAKRLGRTKFAGVATIALDGGILADLWTQQKLGAESTVSLVRDDGMVVARYPALDKTADVSGQPPFGAMAGEASGVYGSEKSPVDGVARVVAFTRLPSLNVLAFASVSQDAVLTGLWTSITIVLWLMVPIAVALLGGSFLTARVLRRSAREQANLAAALAHNEVLFKEIHHRVKNNLQSVGSLLQMQPIPREIKTNMGQRIAAMAAVHEHIYRSSNFATVHVKGYLETLIASIRAGASPSVRVVEQLDDLSVDKDAATPLGLILNEVVANAFKHAFPDGREGVITVTLARQSETVGKLIIEDNGTGFDPNQPAKGIGRRLVAALTEQLKGESAVEPVEGGGSRFVLSFPLAA